MLNLPCLAAILSLFLESFKLLDNLFFIFLIIYLLKIFIYISSERGEGREKERERNINVSLPLARPLLGTWPATQTCALTGN